MRARRDRIGPGLAAGALAGLLLVASAAAASAQSATPGARPGGMDQIVLRGQLVVPEDQTVRTAAVLFGPARIYGTVRETVFVLRGRADISGTVEDDVVVIDGPVIVRSGAHVSGDIVSRTPPLIEKGATVEGERRDVATRFDSERFGFASRFVWWLGYSASTLFLGLLLLALFRGLDAALTRAWRGGAGSAVGFGVAVLILLPIVAVLFLVTVVGIPLGLFLLLGLALVYTVGYVAGVQTMGRLIVRPPRGRYLAFLAGWVIARLLALVPIVGGLAFLVLAVVGLGALLVAARRPEPLEEIAPPPPPPPAVPAPV